MFTRGASQRSQQSRFDRDQLRFIAVGRRGTLAAITGASVVGGATEAAFLLLATRTAFGITDGSDSIDLAGKFQPSLAQCLLIALVLVVVRYLLVVIAARQSAHLISDVLSDLREQLSDAFLRSTWKVQQLEKGGALQEILSSYATSASTVIGGVTLLLVSLANLVAMLTIAVVVDPAGAAVLVLCVGVFGSMLRPLRSLVRRRAAESARAGLEFASAVNEISHLGMELHVFNVQDQASRKLYGLINKSRLATQRVQAATGLVSPTYSTLAYLALLAALAFVVESDTTKLTSLGGVMLVMLRSLGYGQALQGASTTISSGLPMVQALHDKLIYFERSKVEDGAVQVPALGDLSFDNVSFAYTDEQTVLRDLSFEIRAGEIVGVVGPSGGGKSTLVQLILGLRSPTTGQIRAGDHAISDFTRESWSRHVTFVPQTPRLIAGSIRDNIRFFRERVSDDDVAQAAKRAHLHDDVMAFPEGYLREVGEQGGNLSGGQQQRLCIARALVETPDLLVLDEPTSSLDVRSEHLIRETLVSLRASTTIIIIAHRMSTLDICDRIMVIQDGAVKAFDTPTRLEATSEFYREALALSGLR